MTEKKSWMGRIIRSLILSTQLENYFLDLKRIGAFYQDESKNVNAGGNITYWSNVGSSSAGGEPIQSLPIRFNKGLFTILFGGNALSGMTQPLVLKSLLHPSAICESGSAQAAAASSNV